MSTFETLKRSCQRLAKQKYYLYFLQLRCGQNKESQRVLKVYIKQNFTLKSTKPLTVCFSGFCNINKSLTDSSMMTNVSLPFKASFNQITDSIFIHITLDTLLVIDVVISKCFIGSNPNLRLFGCLVDASFAGVNQLFGQLRSDPHGHSNAGIVVRHFVTSELLHYF